MHDVRKQHFAARTFLLMLCVRLAGMLDYGWRRSGKFLYKVWGCLLLRYVMC